MSNIEKQLDTIMRCLAAETEEDREQARMELQKMVGWKPEKVTNTHISTQIISTVLLDVGVPCHLKGHPYLIDAVEAVVNNPDLINAVTGELYPQVAKTFQTTPSRVERAIRHAIEVAWSRGDIDILKHYFGNTISYTKGKPTNSEFISRVANVVRMRLNEVA